LLYLFDFQHVLDLVDHASYHRRVVVFHNLIHLSQTERSNDPIVSGVVSDL
jgi:hypothetical protein